MSCIKMLFQFAHRLQNEIMHIIILSSILIMIRSRMGNEKGAAGHVPDEPALAAPSVRRDDQTAQHKR